MQYTFTISNYKSDIANYYCYDRSNDYDDDDDANDNGIFCATNITIPRSWMCPCG